MGSQAGSVHTTFLFLVSVYLSVSHVFEFMCVFVSLYHTYLYTLHGCETMVSEGEERKHLKVKHGEEEGET